MLPSLVTRKVYQPQDLKIATDMESSRIQPQLQVVVNRFKITDNHRYPPFKDSSISLGLA